MVDATVADRAITVEVMDLGGSMIKADIIKLESIPPVIDSSLVFSEPIADYLADQKQPYGDVYLHSVVDKLVETRAFKLEEYLSIDKVNCFAQHVHVHDPDMNLVSYMAAWKWFPGKDILSRSFGQFYEKKRFPLILSMFNVKEVLDKCAELSGGQPSGTDQDILSYTYKGVPWTVNLKDPIGAFNTAEALMVKREQDGYGRTVCVPYNPYRIDWTLFSLLYYPLGNNGAATNKREKPVIVPGLHLDGGRLKEFEFLMRRITSTLNISVSDGKKLRRDPTLTNYYYTMCCSDVDLMSVDQLFKHLGYHREWLRARVLLALCREYNLPGYLERYALSIIGRSTGVPVYVRCLQWKKGTMDTLRKQYSEHDTPTMKTIVFYYDGALLSRVRPVDDLNCPHNNMWYGMKFKRRAEIQTLKAFRVSGECLDSQSLRLVDDSSFNGVSLPLVTSKRDIRPLIVVAWVPVDIYNNCFKETADYMAWSQLIKGNQEHVHPMMARDYDNLLYGMEHTIGCIGEKRGGGSDFFNEITLSFLVLHSYDHRIWSMVETTKFRVNNIMRFVNTMLKYAREDENNNSDIGKHFRDGCELLLNENRNL
jgi:hypothetical protein